MFKIDPLLFWRFCRHDRRLLNWINSRPLSNVVRRYSGKVDNKKPTNTIDEGPIKFSTSEAFGHRAEDSRSGELSNRPPYEGEVVMICLATFLIYFCVLREENDIDKELGKSLYDRIEGLEEVQLKVYLQYSQERGLDTVAIEKRLEEIRREKIAKESSVPKQI